MSAGTLATLCWLVITCVPILYSLLNLQRIRKQYILPESPPTPLVRDPFLLLWAAITLAVTQVGLLLVSLSSVSLLLTGPNYQPVGVLGAFVCVGSLLGFLIASCEVSWEKEKGRSPLLWRELRDAYYLLIYANPIGVTILLLRGMRRFFLPGWA